MTSHDNDRQPRPPDGGGDVAEVEEEARRGLPEDHWRAFTGGTPEEVRKVWAEEQETSDYLEQKRQDKETQGRAFGYLREHPGRAYLDAGGDLWSLADAPPGEVEGPGGRLSLRVTTPRGVYTYAPGYVLERPPDWCPPYGLR